MPSPAELEHRAEIQFEKLGVAEHLGGWLAAFVALATYLKWESWLFAVVALVVAYLAATIPYKRRHTAAKSAFESANRSVVPFEANDAV